MAKILVVEDNELNMRLFVDLLKSKEYAVLCCNRADCVVDMVLKERPDLVLMDVQLPFISGLDLTKRIRKNKAIKATKIIAVSAFAMAEDKERILAAGCNDYISKPIDINSFFETIQHHLKQ